jgi:uroporphyrinogen decarboxylase
MHLNELAGKTAAWAVTKRIDHLPLLLVFCAYLEMLTRTGPHSVDLQRRVIWAFRWQTRHHARLTAGCETIGGVNSEPSDSAFIRACRRQPVSHAPVWYMRQAGRALPEYRALRAGTAMLDACANPEMVTEITLQPVRRYGVDAAVLFSDIVVPLRAVGVGVEIRAGVGPVIDQPVRTEADVARLRDLDPAELPFIAKAVSLLTAELGGTPLIGFAGGPFTLACYLIDGGPSKNFEKTRALMYGNPELWASLLGKLAGITTSFLKAQVTAGASAVQLFDSWAGVLSPQDYQRSVLPFSSRVFSALADSGVPRIHFGVGTGELLGLLGEAGADVVGVDWRVPLDEAVHRVSPGKALQGNLDPAILLAPWPVIEDRARDVLARGRMAESHIFNLGHGVLPETNPDMLARLTDLVHAVPAG